MKYFIVFVFALLTASCSNLTPKTVTDAAHDLCVAVFAGRAEVRAQAARQGVSPVDIARAACAINDVVRPFFAASQTAGDEAMGTAQKMGLVQK